MGKLIHVLIAAIAAAMLLASCTQPATTTTSAAVPPTEGPTVTEETTTQAETTTTAEETTTEAETTTTPEETTTEETTVEETTTEETTTEETTTVAETEPSDAVGGTVRFVDIEPIIKHQDLKDESRYFDEDDLAFQQDTKAVKMALENLEKADEVENFGLLTRYTYRRLDNKEEGTALDILQYVDYKLQRIFLEQIDLRTVGAETQSFYYSDQTYWHAVDEGNFNDVTQQQPSITQINYTKLIESILAQPVENWEIAFGDDDDDDDDDKWDDEVYLTTTVTHTPFVDAYMEAFVYSINNRDTNFNSELRVTVRLEEEDDNWHVTGVDGTLLFSHKQSADVQVVFSNYTVLDHFNELELPAKPDDLDLEMLKELLDDDDFDLDD